MIVFNRNYAALAFLLFVIEVMIALFIRDKFIRPYLGDVLVVILLYCLLRTFASLSTLTGVLTVLSFSCMVELLQYADIVTVLGWQDSKIARIVIGTSFSWLDLLAYTAGCGIVLGIEMYLIKKRNPSYGILR